MRAGGAQAARGDRHRHRHRPHGRRSRRSASARWSRSSRRCPTPRACSIMDEPTAALTSAKSSGCSRSCASSRQRRRHHLHFAPAGGGAARRRPRHGDARRLRRRRQPRRNAPQAELVRLLVGRPLDELYPKRAQTSGRRLLNLDRRALPARRERAGWQPPRDVTLTCTPARSSGSPASWAPGARSC